jgi:preprotein translocase subunit SecF
MLFVLILFTLYVIAISITKGLSLNLNFDFGDSTSSDIERYIKTKQPTNVAEVEKLVQEYTYNTNCIL